VIKVFIADDQVIIREGLKKILHDLKDIRVVGEAGTADELREKLKSSKADIILLDLNIPGSGLFNLITELKELHPNLFILVVTIYPEKAYAIRAMKQGADGFITKSETLETLETAIRTIMKTGKFLSTEVGLLLAEELNEKEPGFPHNSLSVRELEILRLISKGKKIKEIAEELSLSISTVNTYRLRILKKMKMETDAAIVKYAIENKLVF
jgi:two-component system, NarL family, invasion response regulator UvrY